MILACRSDNDLYRVLVESNVARNRVNSIDSALSSAREGEAVLVLADDYPRASLTVTQNQLDLAASKRLRMYIEYPAAISGIELGEPAPTQWERAVVSSEFFGAEPCKDTILALHGCWYLPVSGDVEPHVVVARVAGYHRAVFGIPENASPVFFELPGHDVLVATTKLSQFVTARYGPAPAWKALWQRILSWLTCSPAPELAWKPTVGVQAGPHEPLPPSAEADALSRVVEWFSREALFSIDNKKGGIEGFEAGIDYCGRQKRRIWLRSDCIAETGMAFVWDWAVSGNPESKQTAQQILDYVWSPDFYQNDPDSPVYGLMNWFERGPVFYGDDDARVILSTLIGASLLNDDRWNERVLRCLLANLRTTGPLGFRQPRLDWPGSFEEGRGWQHWREQEVIHLAPHYQAYLWGAYLWGYALTGYQEFYDKARSAIKMTMEAYPNWRWTNGLTQEMARMLLPLSFLVRIDDTPEHRQWLQKMADELLAQMQPCGAIQEKLGPEGTGAYAPPSSNESYGTNEASLIQEEGDAACDLLYTTNYAFIGLHEAACATGDAKLKSACEKLAEFLCRVQVRSEQQPYLDGAWMRSFDYKLWDYWGSSADHGWGAWSVESGWTNSWIAATFAMRRLNSSLFDLQMPVGFADPFGPILEEMIPETDNTDARVSGVGDTDRRKLSVQDTRN